MTDSRDLCSGQKSSMGITWRLVKSSGDSHAHLSLRSTRLPTGEGHIEMSAFAGQVKGKVVSTANWNCRIFIKSIKSIKVIGKWLNHCKAIHK